MKKFLLLLLCLPMLAGAQLTVDFAAKRGAPTYKGAGFLLSMEAAVPGWGPDYPHDSLLAPLKPSQWRVGAYSLGNYAFNQVRRLNRLGVTKIQILVESFSHSPGQDYYDYENWMPGDFAVVGRKLAERARDSGYTFIYDPMNEPDPYTTTLAQFLVKWVKVDTAVKAVTPTAEFVGPDLGQFDSVFVKGFLDSTYAISQRLAKDVMPEVLSFHNLLFAVRERFDNSYDLETSVRILKRYLAAHPEYKQPRICIQEYTNPDFGVYSPGHAIDNLAFAEQENVEMIRASWYDIMQVDQGPNQGVPYVRSDLHPSLDGILTLDTKGHPNDIPNALRESQPRGVWHAYKGYGDMKGQMLAVTPNLDFNGFASMDSATGTALLLMGQREGADGSDINTYITLKDIPTWLQVAGQVNIKIESIPETTVGLLALPFVSEQSYAVSSNGSIYLPIAVPLGGGLRISLTGTPQVVTPPTPPAGPMRVRGRKPKYVAMAAPEYASHTMLAYTMHSPNKRTYLQAKKDAGYTVEWAHVDNYDAAYAAETKAFLDSAYLVGMPVMVGSQGGTPFNETVKLFVDTWNHPAIYRRNGLRVYADYDHNPETFQRVIDTLANKGISADSFMLIASSRYPVFANNQWSYRVNTSLYNDPSGYTVSELYRASRLKGLFNFSVAKDYGLGALKSIVDENRIAGAVSKEQGKVFFAGVNSLYASGQIVDGGFEMLDSIWMGILALPVADRPAGVCDIAANDLGELNSMGPSMVPLVNGVGHIPAVTTPGFLGSNNRESVLDHAGINGYTKPYRVAYLTGQPTVTITEEKMFGWYALHPADQEPVDTIPQFVKAMGSKFTQSWWENSVYGSGVLMVNGQNQAALIATYFTKFNTIRMGAHLTAPGYLEIERAGNVFRSALLQPGLRQFEAPNAFGTPVFRIIAADGVTVRKQGAGAQAVTNNLYPGGWNYLITEVQ